MWLESSLFKSSELFEKNKQIKRKIVTCTHTQAGGKVIATQTWGGHSFSAHPRENSQRALESENRDVADMAAVTSCSPVKVMHSDTTETRRALQRLPTQTVSGFISSLTVNIEKKGE